VIRAKNGGAAAAARQRRGGADERKAVVGYAVTSDAARGVGLIRLFFKGDAFPPPDEPIEQFKQNVQ
jgi:hypothetical protein